MSVLRAAANQIAQEEHQEGLDGMLKAADEIANERGLNSPLRRSPNRGDAFKENLEASNSNGAPIERFSPRAASGATGSVDGAELDALMLLKQMNIEPKVSATVGFVDDVQALLDHSEKTLDKGKTMPAASNNTRISAMRQRYKDKMGRLTTRSVHSSTSTMRGLSLTSEPAEVAQLLSLADDKPYGESIRRSFRTEIEEILFRSTYLIQRPHSGGERQSVDSSGSRDSKKKYEKMRKSADRLSAVPRKEPADWERSADRTLRYLTLEEAQECTFRPHLRSAQKKNNREQREDDGAKEDPRFSFISRQEAEERNRREELQFKMGKKDYDALVDKKVCPQCGAKQSYDEVKEKRKLCVNCRVEYTNPMTWAKVRNKFWKKCQEFSKRVALHKQAIMEEIEREYKFIIKKAVDEQGKVVEVMVPRSHILTEEEEQEFFRRIEEKLLEKDAKLKRLDRELYEEKYSFKPTVKQYKSDNRDSDDDASNAYSDDEKNVVQAFLQRYEEDMDYRREKLPQKYLKIRRKFDGEADIAPFKV
ncbi:hypothetical protein EON64_04075 [archaeon]|nr:MAG: hypothetical protein EON64_04075 [archaeon]